MIKLEKTDVFGWEAAIRGLRNPMNSWDMSDSHYGCEEQHCDECTFLNSCRVDYPHCYYSIGVNDLKLMRCLSRAGDDHGKFLRMINVTVDITAPLYWWKEFDTYKVGTVANSCSTMHKIADKEFTIDDFSHEHLFVNEEYPLTEVTDDHGVTAEMQISSVGVLNVLIGFLNHYRKEFIKTKNKLYWWQMIQLLPSSYNQKRTVQLNYQVLKSMYFARMTHKLDEWRQFCKWCESLPYFREVVIQE